jgi:hypothetical protein
MAAASMRAKAEPSALRENINFNQIIVSCAERPEPPTRARHWFCG